MARRKGSKGQIASIGDKAALNTAIIRQIEKVIKNWEAAPAAVKQRFKKARRVPAKKIASQFNAIANSERLTEADFAIRINTRD